MGIDYQWADEADRAAYCREIDRLHQENERLRKAPQEVWAVVMIEDGAVHSLHASKQAAVLAKEAWNEKHPMIATVSQYVVQHGDEK